MDPLYDLIIVTDATASMGTYLESLRTSIPEILALSTLSGAFERLGVLAYKDYSEMEPDIIAWSGWNRPDLLDFVANLEATGGGDYPEAAKTALIRVLQEVKRGGGRETLILWYADAPPHHPAIQSINNRTAEINAFPKGATDWVKLSYLATKMKLTIFSFIPTTLRPPYSSFYVFLSQITGGLCLTSDAFSDAHISRLTLEILLQWMGQGADINSRLKEKGVTFSQYKDPPIGSERPSNESDGSNGYLPPALSDSSASRMREIVTVPLRSSDIPLGPLAAVPLKLAERFADPDQTRYRVHVYASLGAIIDSNVHALTYNNIFGQLWRAVCKQPPTADQTTLLNAFSNRISAVTDPVQKVALQMWLEESFDATSQIEDIIASADPQGPWVYLDLDAEVNLTRVELLEVSRSCYSGVLKNLTTIFTHLKLVEPNVPLASGQRSIPLSLPPLEFFRILPHLVVPGTLYPPRAASLTAVLSLITAVTFLREPATALLSPLKGTWIDFDVPENISFDCARFLLSAPEGVLSDEERDIYAAMRRYKLIELNLESTIHVKVPWTPEKARDIGDRKIECHQCHIRRSVTIMSEERLGICGMCISFHTKKPEDFQDKGEMESCWVECSVKTCRAQYVVEDVQALNVRPKCYYCRSKKSCPWLECTRCTNRIIVPTPYRASKKTKYVCLGCNNPDSKVATITEQATNPMLLNTENGVSWLGFTANDDIFKGKSAFKLMQAHGTSVFKFTASDVKTELTIRGKKVHHPLEARRQVERWVGSGEVELGSCTLCFSEMPKQKLVPACGRKGCSQRVDHDCLREWYGKNEPGKLLNVMELACPFCRRKPATQTLTRYNPRAMALCGLKDAMADRQFFYAWCIGCGFAKQAFERVCCEAGLPKVKNFRCPDCTRIAEIKEEERLAEIRERERISEVNRQEIIAAEVRTQKRIRITICPGCTVAVEKTFGCNHVQCVCGVHFCYLCGAGDRTWTPGSVYHHMRIKHNGDFGIDSDEEDEGLLL